MNPKLKRAKVRPLDEVVLEPWQMASIARSNHKHRHKKSLRQFLTEEQMAEVLRIRAIQQLRYERRGFVGADHQEVRPLDIYERRGIKRKAWKTTMCWSRRWDYRCGFKEHIAEPMQRSWKYKSRVKYRVHVTHSSKEVKYESSRPACSYDTLSVTLTFDLLRHTWKWIGGMLTIMRKEDVGKTNYPCWWFQHRMESTRWDGRKPGVGLEVKQGWILGRNYHITTKPDATLDDARAKRKRVTELAREKEERRINQQRQENEDRAALSAQECSWAYMPRKGWVNRHLSIMSGNCPGGTDSFIAGTVAEHFRKLGFTVGELRGVSIKKSLLFELRKDAYTKRVFKG